MSYKEFVAATGFVPGARKRSLMNKVDSVPGQSPPSSPVAPQNAIDSPSPQVSPPTRRPVGGGSIATQPTSTSGASASTAPRSVSIGSEQSGIPVQGIPAILPGPKEPQELPAQPVPVSNLQSTRLVSAAPIVPVTQQQSPQPSTISTRQPLTEPQIDAALQTCLDLQKTSTSLHSKRPFAAVLLAPDNTTILQTHFSISHFQHAESELSRLCALSYSPEYLWSCTLISTWEPCAMCAGTIYWSNIGRVVYAASEEKLKSVTGPNNPENMTMSLPCREVLSRGQKDIEVVGPVGKWEDVVVEHASSWWKGRGEPVKGGSPSSTLTKENGSVDGNNGGEESMRNSGNTPSVAEQSAAPTSVRNSVHSGTQTNPQDDTQSTRNDPVVSRSVSNASSTNKATVWNEKDNTLGDIDESGEYKADLKGLDWMR